jgi:hypothetical protein
MPLAKATKNQELIIILSLLIEEKEIKKEIIIKYSKEPL